MSTPIPPPMSGAGHPAGGLPPPPVDPRHDLRPDAGPPTGSDVPYDVGDVSLGELIGNVTRDLSALLRQELALAQAEVKQEAGKAARGAGAMAGAAVAGFFVVLFLSLALWAGLSNVLDPGWAGLVVAVIWAVIAAVLFFTGRAKLRQIHPTPERTVETLGQVPDALKGSQGGKP